MRPSRGLAIAAASCGLGAAVLTLAVPLAGACGERGYSHVAQFISELGAAGAANAWWVSAAGFAPIGALVLAFVALASKIFPRSRRTTAGVTCLAAVGAAYLVAAFFPCDPGCPSEGSLSQSIHNAFGLVEYVGAIAGLLLLGAGLRDAPAWRGLARMAVIAALLVVAGLGAMLAPELASVRGLSQRVAETGIFGWIAYASVLSLRSRWDRPNEMLRARSAS